MNCQHFTLYNYIYIYIYYDFGLDKARLPSNCPNSATIESLIFCNVRI